MAAAAAAEDDDEEKRLSVVDQPVVFLSVGSGPDKAQAQAQAQAPPRLPRWTRQELLVLIQGKRVAENRVRRGIRTTGGGSSSGQGQVVVEPKWSSVSSYCKRHGVNRGPVQCRKRWSNLAGDFKKINEWESHIADETESFWLMRNDLRRDRKLPGFFDREVYDILLNGGPDAAAGDKSLVLSLAPSLETQNHQVVFDSGGRPEDDDLFSDQGMTMISTSPEEKHKEAANAPTPVSATRYEPFSQGAPPPPQPPAPSGDKETSPSPEGKKKRKRDADADEDMSLHNQLIEAMERNGRLLTSQLEIQNTNSQLDRDQRKDHANSLFAVLNKLADAMVRIADKL